MRKPEEVITSVMTKLEKHGKGIILMHDFRRATAEALPELLRQLKAGGIRSCTWYRIRWSRRCPNTYEMVTQKVKLLGQQYAPRGKRVATIGGLCRIAGAACSDVHE